MTPMSENNGSENTRDVSAAMMKSRSNSSEYAGGDGSFHASEVESQSSQGASGGNTSASKRRTKASRACDQCRKRKIRCDYDDDKGVCTSCRKNGESCAFERIQLKRGPSKGAVRGHSVSRSISGENNNTAATAVGSGGEFSSPSSRQGSVLLPPLGQYLPQPAPVPSNLNATQQQQFWKVPYHDFQGQRRGSIDSLSSDMSAKSVNIPQEHLLYASPSAGHPPLHSPVTFGPNNSSTDSGYWPFRNSGGEESDELRRKSGSNPPSLKNVSQPPPPPLQQQQQQYSYSKFNNSFAQYGANGFPSRHGSIASEGMSPSASVPYQSVPMNQSNSNGLSQQQQQPIQWPKVQPKNLPPPQVQVQAADKEETLGNSFQKTIKKRRTVSASSGENKAEPGEYPLARFSSSGNDSLLGGNLVSPAGFVYGQIPEIQLIDTYYEFIHMVFPIIPLNKETVTNEILLVNTQPISPIHEINNYVILWFRNSLELLIRITLKRRSGLFYDSLTHSKERELSNEIRGNSNGGGSNDSKDDNLEMQGVFVTALNECLQKIVDIHPSFRENKDKISPKVKIIYLSTFVLLNYILAVVGYDNSFVLGMSTTIFKDFKVYELLLYDDEDDDATKSGSNDNDNTNNDNNSNNANNDNNDSRFYDENNAMNWDQAGYSITFKRLYVLLIIFDSLQCCSYGGPKLLNVPIEGASERFFQTKPHSNSKWVVDQSPTRMKFILQSVKFGELLAECSMKRRSICDLSRTQLTWEIPPYFLKGVTDEDDELFSLAQLLAAFILIRKEFVDCLLNLQDLETGELPTVDMELCGELIKLLCQLTSIILQALTVMMRTNPKNHIDYNYRPMKPMEHDDSGNSASRKFTTSQAESGKNSGNDFYHKLLGLQDNAEACLTNLLRGSISPYCISMLREIRNVMELVKKMPASLIGVVMACAGTHHNTANNNNNDPLAIIFQSQELVVKLSNCMNDMMQITSLLNMIKPVNLSDQDSDNTSATATITTTETISKSLNRDHSIMRRLYYSKAAKRDKKHIYPSSSSSPQLQETITTLKSFVLIGWKLLDDFELGWS
ncbi:hypothetical protein ZYGR_0P02260 [Zygosaccharomyces rouxii]|uniref:Zn(2)-C6 fungal-type domain-containing protein n=1 Tax=Zygosaccharomyces rouxii TaxID=4956 RepID=A0A1Q3A1J3_ZYGRO|nr:hypothetical protein ZYGR_0P02260 [Zygosaccharomyces rouxii]